MTYESSSAQDQEASGASWLLRRLSEYGVTHLFGVPGGPLLSLYESLSDSSDIVPVLAKHEEGAGFMAEGFALASGRLGVASGTTGPGTTNALTAVASATSDYVPMLFLSGHVATDSVGKGALQDSTGGNWSVDTVAALASATKLSTSVSSSAQLPRFVDHAVRTATSLPPGTAHLSIPSDVLANCVDPASVLPAVRLSEPFAPAPQAVRDLVGALVSSRSPVILAGQGAKASRAGEELIRLADHLEAPVATTLKGKGVVDETHPRALGVFGFGGSEEVCDRVFSEDIDLVLIVGSGMGELATLGWDQRLVCDRVVCQIDVEPTMIGRNFGVHHAVHGDARTALQGVLDALVGSRPGDAARGSHPPARQELPSARDMQGEYETLLPSAVVRRLSELLPLETTLFVDNGNCLSWVGQYYVAHPARQIHFSFNIGSMGFATAAVIGGKLAAPDRPSVALVGDAAFAMHGMEVHTAVELDLPAIWVVLNNGGHAMVGNMQQMMYGRTEASWYKRPMNIGGVATALGAAASRVESLEALDEAVGTALTASGPYVIDARVDFEEVPWALRSRAQTLSKPSGDDLASKPRSQERP